MDRYRTDLTSRGATDPACFFDRRAFLRVAAIGAMAPAACAQTLDPDSVAPDDPRLQPPRAWPEGFAVKRNESFVVPKGIDPRLTPRAVAASHNNYYEFLPGRGGAVWRHTDDFVVDPWQVEITGACAKPRTFGLEEIDAIAHEERLYHFRCVERWSMNVPWTGFPLRTMLEQVEPTGKAKYVRFFTAERKDQMPGLRELAAGGFTLPYHEALRMDEAMHDLTFVATGVYGKPLLKQHGAPIRIVVPWKYGYKSPKSVVRIELVEEKPPTFWSRPPYGHEYGFISNVNPSIPHPRWAQDVSHWLDTRKRFATQIFNGYGREVAVLYPDEPSGPQVPLRPGQVAR